MISRKVATILILAFATPAFSQPAADKAAADKPAATATATADKKPAAEKLICTREAPPGTNIPKRICRTQTDVERSRDSAQRILQDERGATKPTPGVPSQ